MTRNVWHAWNRLALADWIESEQTSQNLSYTQLETQLGVPHGTIDLWRLTLAPQLSPFAIQAIARYRGWSPDQVRTWLQLENEATK